MNIYHATIAYQFWADNGFYDFIVLGTETFYRSENVFIEHCKREAQKSKNWIVADHRSIVIRKATIDKSGRVSPLEVFDTIFCTRKTDWQHATFYKSKV